MSKFIQLILETLQFWGGMVQYWYHICVDMVPVLLFTK